MKYILCQPYNGFNDAMSQVYKAWKYAERTGRTLVVDTERSCLRDHFENYFIVTTDYPKVMTRVTHALLDELNAMQTYPACLRGRLDSYVPVWSKETRSVLEQSTGRRLDLNFARDYDEELVVHATAGSGDPVELFSHLQLRKELGECLAEYLAPLGDDYYAVHVRNTDYKTNYKAYFLKIAPELAGKTVLICSDDWRCREVARVIFSRSKVVSLTDIPKLPVGKTLHNCTTNIYKNNLDMLLDLLGLAGAARLFVAPVDSIMMPGGFGRLAADLNRRKDILRHFSGRG